MRLPREQPNRPRKDARLIAALGLLFVLMTLLGCVHPRSSTSPVSALSPLPTTTTANRPRLVLPAEKAAFVYVLPDGRGIVFRVEDELVLLDVATGRETPIPGRMAWVVWLDDNLLYGESDDECYVATLQPVSVVGLETLPADSAALAGHIRAAGDLYVLTTAKGHALLLLGRDASGNVTQGYVVQGARNLELLLAGIPYKTPSPHPYYSEQEQYPSPDGRYYYTCAEAPGTLRIYSRDGRPLNSVSTPGSTLACHGWAADSSGVYFQANPSGSAFKVGPLELLPVGP